MKRINSNGFTLIEMLAVIAIISILASIAFAKGMAAIEKAKIAKAIQEIANINYSIQMYKLNSGGDLPLQISNLIPDYYYQAPVDPWGTPYVYNNFTQIPPGWRRKDGSLVPINKEYDIFSQGPDKQSAAPINSNEGKDDILFANDGAFIDVANKYTGL